jgi:YD repeat-containing protein
MDYDPDGKGWYVYGHGQVSADGTQVVPDSKTRVWAFHGAMFNVSTLPPWATSWLDNTLGWLSGDPVDLSTGLLTDSRTDLAVDDPLTPIDVTRTYWQGDTESRAFGIGRDLTYNAFLHSEQQYQEVDLYLPGGRKIHYNRTSAGTSYIDAVFETTGASGQFRGTKIHWNGNSGWDMTFPDGTVWVFPQYAALKEIRDRHGNTLTLTRAYGTLGNLTRVTTSGGRWIALTYDTSNRVTQARDNVGRTVSYTYDDAGRLKTVTDPAGKVSSYTYDGTSNRIATAKDARGIVYMSNTYYADGRINKQTLTEGQEYSFAYTTTGTGEITATEVTQPGGAVRRVEFDGGYGTSDTQAYGSSLARKTVYERGPGHRVDAVVDPYGRRTELSYDANGHVTKALQLAGTSDARSTGSVVFRRRLRPAGQHHRRARPHHHLHLRPRRQPDEDHRPRRPTDHFHLQQRRAGQDSHRRLARGHHLHLRQRQPHRGHGRRRPYLHSVHRRRRPTEHIDRRGRLGDHGQLRQAQPDPHGHRPPGPHHRS